MISVQVDHPKWLDWHNESEWEDFFSPISDECLKKINIEYPVDISVLLTHDSYVQGLNKHYRMKDAPTNVLSFPQETKPIKGSTEPVMLGDIVMSFETIQSEAQEQNILFMNHLTHLFVHGLLHLLGYDHIEEDEAEVMEALEINILSTLNIKNPYQ